MASENFTVLVNVNVGLSGGAWNVAMRTETHFEIDTMRGLVGARPKGNADLERRIDCLCSRKECII
jgi:hypothetical protein